jgi:hypothetical protein
MWGAAILFFAAAFVEAFWSPSTFVPFAAKVAVGTALWVIVLGYLTLAGRGRAD